MVACSFLFLLTAPTTFAQQVQTTTSQISPSTWYNNGGTDNWDYSGQTALGTSNVNDLTTQWIIPIPPAPPGWSNTQGVQVTPMIVNGIVYAFTNWYGVFAFNAQSGAVIWQTTLPINTTGLFAAYNIADIAGGGALFGHTHASSWQYTDSPNVMGGEPLIWIDTTARQIFAVDALTGDVKVHIYTQFPNETAPGVIPGNYGQYSAHTPSMIIDQQNGMLLLMMDPDSGAASGRAYMDGWNVSSNPPVRVWRDFLMPPEDGSQPGWSLDQVGNATDAYIFNGTGAVNLKTLPASTLNSTLYDDWGNSSFNGQYSESGGPSTGWGGAWVVDPNTGVAYVGTGQPSPFDGATRPGPNLWSDSILAINMTNGHIIWGFQAVPHDNVDWDCSWVTALANETINGVPTQVVFKSCKSGYVFELNAQTGQLYWSWTPPQSVVPRCPYCEIYNPLNRTQMDLPWLNYPSTAPTIVNPGATGAIESDFAFDPTTNQIFVGAYNAPANESYIPVSNFTRATLYEDSGYTGFSCSTCSDNTTIMAINAATGQTEWQHFIPQIGFRGGLTATNGVVIAPLVNGSMLFLNENNGQEVGNKFLGSAMIIEPAIGQDASGDFRMVEPVSASTLSAGEGLGFDQEPGFVIGFGLSSSAISATSAATATGVSSITQQGGTATVTVTASSVVTITGASGGVSSGAFYAVVAVAVILAIIAAVFAMRRRPATPTTTTSANT